jgi:6-phosphogluconolactonase
MFVYVGTYTEPPNGSGEGIYVYQFDTETGQLSLIQTVTGIVSPSYLVLSPDHLFVSAVSETDRGDVFAYTRDGQTGRLTALNSQSSHGAAPCYVSTDAAGRWAFVANYNGGTVASFPIRENGELGPAASVVRHEGSSVNPQRQREPHPHMISPSSDGRFVLATDLGTDRVMVYEVDDTSGELRPNTKGPTFAELPPGSGPRHFAFSPTGRIVYVINELISSVTVFSYDHETAAMEEVQSISTLPDDFTGESYCAHVVVSPDGRFVYGSNRYHDSLAIFAVNAADGALTPVAYESTRGKTPRNFALDPSSTWLLAANQESDTIVTFRRDPDSGELTATGPVTDVPNPVAVVFV